ncbi:hypothetical protein FSARC_14981, partial [Fusarium sarcochroum]
MGLRLFPDICCEALTDRFRGTHDLSKSGYTVIFDNDSAVEQIHPCVLREIHANPQLRLQDVTGPGILKYIEDHPYSNSILKDMEEIEAGITAKLVYNIPTRACGVLLWIVLVFRILIRQLQDYDSVLELLQEIDNLPADLEPLYDR